MQVKLIEERFAAYRAFLRGPERFDRLHWWASQRIFQENWQLQAEDKKAMYDRSLQNSHTQRLWKREGYEPKRMMLLFWDVHEVFVQQMFRDLFNEGKDIAGRIDRFVFHCDELLAQHRLDNPMKMDNRHYHDDDYGMVSLYLAFQYPDQYAPYDAEGFVALLRQLGTRELPQANDFGRFCKVMRTLHTLMKKDAALMAAHQRRLRPEEHYIGESLLLVYDFYQFCQFHPPS